MRKHFYCIAAIFCFMLSFFAWGSIQSDAAAAYKINVENAVATVNGKTVTEAAAGEQVTLTAVKRDGYSFVFWELVKSTKTEYREPEYSWQDSYVPIWSLEEVVSSEALETSPVTFTMPESDITGRAEYCEKFAELNFVYIPEVGAEIEKGENFVEYNKYGFCLVNRFYWLVSTDGVNYTYVYSEEDYYNDNVPCKKFEEGKYYSIRMEGMSDGLYDFEGCVFKLNGVVCTEEAYAQAVNSVANEPKYYGPLVAKQYNISVKDGAATVNGNAATTAKAGEIVTIKATSVAGKIFDGWSTSVTLANKKSETTTFTMPAADVTVEATYKTVSEGSSEQNKDTSTTESESASGSDVMDATDSELVDGATDTGVTDTGTIDGDSDSVNTGVTENGSDVVTNSSSAETGAVSSSGQDNSDAHSGKDGSDSGSSLIPEEEDGLSVGATVAIVGGSVGAVAVVAFVFRKSILALLRAIFRG